ncbi:hypothetical protein SCALM49S_02429 [Streptomyces californicus]
MRVAQRQVRADRPADRAARVAEPLDPEPVQRREQPVGQVGDGRRGVGGRAAVAGQVVAEDPPVLGQLGYLAVPHVPRRPEGGADDQDGGVLGPVEPVLERPGQLARGMRPLAAARRDRRDRLGLRILRGVCARRYGCGVCARRYGSGLRVLRYGRGERAGRALRRGRGERAGGTLRYGRGVRALRSRAVRRPRTRRLRREGPLRAGSGRRRGLRAGHAALRLRRDRSLREAGRTTAARDRVGGGRVRVRLRSGRPGHGVRSPVRGRNRSRTVRRSVVRGGPARVGGLHGLRGRLAHFAHSLQVTERPSGPRVRGSPPIRRRRPDWPDRSC